jgi:hypothetical protein
MSTNQNLSFSIASFWESIIGNGVQKGNAAVMNEKLTGYDNWVDAYHNRMAQKIESSIYSKLVISKENTQAIIQSNKVYQHLTTLNINWYALVTSYKAINYDDFTTITHFAELVAQTLKDILISKDDAFGNEVFDRCADLIEDLYIFIYSLNSEEKIQIIPKLKQLVEDLVELIALLFNLNNNQKIQLFKIIYHSEWVATIVFEKQETKANVQSVSSMFTSEEVKVKTKKIEEKYKDVKITEEIKFSDLPVSELIDKAFDFSKINTYQQNNLILKEIKDKIEDLFTVVQKAVPNNEQGTQMLNAIKEVILNWFTLPNDFRPENCVEFAHFIIKNIQSNLHEIANNTNAGFIQIILPFINKLEAILATIDNNNFKLIIAPKGKAYIHEIQLPNLLEPEEEAIKVKGQTPILQSNTANTADSTATTANETDSETANETEKTEEDKPLTISAIVDYLCFDREYGAFNKLSEEQYVVIYDLYYKQWFSNRLDTIIDDAQELFSLETLTAIWEELKALLLNEKGVNLGALIDFIVEKGTVLLNQILNFAKETITYIIDELFLLVKAIIAFFQKVDLPPAARELLKKLPPFANMPDEVTLLHILAAIPYTLWQEFVNFEVKTQTV